jgi:SPP1 family predicted phage head-tail adaptor
MFPSSVLTKKIEFIKKEDSTSSSGYYTKGNEVRQFFLWANMYVKSGSRDFGEYGANLKQTVEWKMNYNKKITSDMIIKHNGYYYKIDFIEELGTKAGQRIETSVIQYDKI